MTQSTYEILRSRLPTSCRMTEKNHHPIGSPRNRWNRKQQFTHSVILRVSRTTPVILRTGRSIPLPVIRSQCCA